MDGNNLVLGDEGGLPPSALPTWRELTLTEMQALAEGNLEAMSEAQSQKLRWLAELSAGPLPNGARARRQLLEIWRLNRSYLKTLQAAAPAAGRNWRG